MYEQIRGNRRASWLLMGFVVALLAALGYAIGAAVVGGPSGGLGLLGVLGVVAILWSILGYYSGDKMVLAVSGAHQVTHEHEPQLFNVVEEMTIAAGLPNVPAVYVIEEQAPNAFATGRDPQHASIAVTRGMMQMLDREELQGVVAHEMSHIRNYDIRFATLVGILVGMIALVADFFLRWSFWGGGGRRRGGGDSNDQAGAVLMVVALVLVVLTALVGTSFAQCGGHGQRDGRMGPGGAALKPAFIHHPESKRHLQALLADLGCDPDETH
jgi:heat shock protein HtpX